MWWPSTKREGEGEGEGEWPAAVTGRAPDNPMARNPRRLSPMAVRRGLVRARLRRPVSADDVLRLARNGMVIGLPCRSGYGRLIPVDGDFLVSVGQIDCDYQLYAGGDVGELGERDAMAEDGRELALTRNFALDGEDPHRVIEAGRVCVGIDVFDGLAERHGRGDGGGAARTRGEELVCTPSNGLDFAAQYARGHRRHLAVGRLAARIEVHVEAARRGGHVHRLLAGWGAVTRGVETWGAVTAGPGRINPVEVRRDVLRVGRVDHHADSSAGQNHRDVEARDGRLDLNLIRRTRAADRRDLQSQLVVRGVRTVFRRTDRGAGVRNSCDKRVAGNAVGDRAFDAGDLAHQEVHGFSSGCARSTSCASRASAQDMEARCCCMSPA